MVDASTQLLSVRRRHPQCARAVRGGPARRCAAAHSVHTSSRIELSVCSCTSAQQCRAQPSRPRFTCTASLGCSRPQCAPLARGAPAEARAAAYILSVQASILARRHSPPPCNHSMPRAHGGLPRPPLLSRGMQACDALAHVSGGGRYVKFEARGCSEQRFGTRRPTCAHTPSPASPCPCGHGQSPQLERSSGEERATGCSQGPRVPRVHG